MPIQILSMPILTSVARWYHIFNFSTFTTLQIDDIATGQSYNGGDNDDIIDFDDDY